MRAKNLIIGESYRLKGYPNCYFAKVLKVMQPKEGENTTGRIIVMCEFSRNKDDRFGLIKYFKPADLIIVKQGE